jgi:uncharacterized protein YecT (DUF1311 family)
MQPFFRALLTLSIASAYALPVVASEGDECDHSNADHMEQVQCISKHILVLDDELNRIYQQALAAMPERDEYDKRKEREQLRRSQRSWLKFKNDHCALIGGLKGGSNLWVTHFGALCEEAEINDRIRLLKSIANGSAKN